MVGLEFGEDEIRVSDAVGGTVLYEVVQYCGVLRACQQSPNHVLSTSTVQHRTEAKQKESRHKWRYIFTKQSLNSNKYSSAFATENLVYKTKST